MPLGTGGVSEVGPLLDYTPKVVLGPAGPPPDHTCDRPFLLRAALAFKFFLTQKLKPPPRVPQSCPGQTAEIPGKFPVPLLPCCGLALGQLWFRRLTLPPWDHLGNKYFQSPHFSSRKFNCPLSPLRAKGRRVSQGTKPSGVKMVMPLAQGLQSNSPVLPPWDSETRPCTVDSAWPVCTAQAWGEGVLVCGKDCLCLRLSHHLSGPQSPRGRWQRGKRKSRSQQA